MLMRTLRLSVMAMAAVVFAGSLAWGMGVVLGQTKEELKLDYGVSVVDHGTGRVTVVLTLADEGRLKPLDEVQLAIPGQETEKDGGHWMDLVVSMDMQQTDDGKRVGRVHIRRDLAERAEIQLNTHTMDGKHDPMTRLHHVIPLAKYLRTEERSAAAARPRATPATERAAAAPSATEKRKD